MNLTRTRISKWLKWLIVLEYASLGMQVFTSFQCISEKVSDFVLVRVLLLIISGLTSSLAPQSWNSLKGILDQTEGVHAQW